MQPIADRLAPLLQEGKTGYAIACTLRAEGYGPKDVDVALRGVGFSVHTEETPWGTILNVSSRPLQDGLAKAVGNLLGGGTEVAWHHPART